MSSTKSISHFYLSVWKNVASAQAFVHLYTDELGRKYTNLNAEKSAANVSNDAEGTVEQVFSSEEGPVVDLLGEGKLRVFVSESFDAALARKARQSHSQLPVQRTDSERVGGTPSRTPGKRC